MYTVEQKIEVKLLHLPKRSLEHGWAGHQCTETKKLKFAYLSATIL